MMSVNLKKRILSSIILCLIVFLIFYSNFFLIYSLLVFGSLALLEFFNLIKRIISNKFLFLAVNTLFTLYLFLFCYMFFFFSNFAELKFINFVLLLGCIGSDIGGFVVGKIFKGPKLTKISPKKTISGALGSFIFTSIVISGLFFYFTNKLNLNIIIISFITSLACQMGDLFISYLKRKSKLKDTGSIIPGHGGVLDRLDGILFGVPLGFLSIILFY